MAIFDKSTLLRMNIIEELGLGALPEDEKDKMLRAMSETLGQRITLRAIEALSEADAQALTDLIDKDPDSAGQFLVERVPNFAEIVQDEVAEFKREMIERAGAV